jgi:TP901 family phage tail tape measure protein
VPASSVVKIALQADVGGFVRNFAEADSAAGKIGATLGGLGNLGAAAAQALDAIGQKAAAVAKGVAAFGAGALVSFTGMGVAAAQFESRLKNVQSLLGEEGPQQFSTNFKQILDLTREFPVSANDAAEGLYNITSSGFQGADAMKVLEVSVRAASAGLTTVETASTAITAVLNAYGLEASKAGDVSDALFQTVNLGVLRFEDLSGVIGDSVGTAAAAGVGYDELGAAIATMTLSGISAAESGTSLNRLLQSMIDPSEALGAAFRAFGFSSGQAAIDALGLHGVMEKLRIASQGNLSTLMQWFPEIRAARGALALMSAEGANYARVASEIENAQARAGATQRAFNSQAESTAMSFQRMINSFKAAAIEIGVNFLPGAKLVIDAITAIANVFGQLPQPIQAVIGWFGALSGAILTIGGLWAAFQLKTFAVNTVMNALGRGLQETGKMAGTAGAGWVSLGQKVESTQGPFRLARTAMIGVSGAANFVGQGIANIGGHIVNLGDRMNAGGGIVSRFGNLLRSAGNAGNLFTGAMNTLKSAVGGLVGLAGPIAMIGIAAFSAFTQGRQAAQEFADSLTKDLKPEKPMSVVKNLAQVQEEMDRLERRMGKATESVGGFFQQFGKDIADALTNVVGIDVIDDSSWDNLMKMDALKESERKILTIAKNMRENITEVFRTLHPDQPVEGLLGLKSEDLNFIALAAEKAGINLTKAFDSSGPARQKAAEEIQRLTGYTSAMGLETGSVSEAVIARFTAMEKATQKAAQGASDAFTKQADLMKAVDPKKMFPDTQDIIPIGLQITQFYDDTIAKATTFYDNIEQLSQRGLDPAALQKFLQAGPDAAGDIVQEAVDDATGGIIDVINRGEAALDKFASIAAEKARLTQMAISSGSSKLAEDLPEAMRVAGEKMTQGKFATPESIAEALGMGPQGAERVRQLGKEFNMGISEAVNFDAIIPKMGPMSIAARTLRGDLENFFHSIIDFSQATPTQAGEIIERLGAALMMPGFTPDQVAARTLAFTELKKFVGDMPDLGEETKGWIIDVIGAEKTKMEIIETFSTINHWAGPPGQKQRALDFVLSVLGQPDAIQKIEEFAAQEKLIPTQKALLLRMLGTDEAKQKALEIYVAIELLKAKNIPITADNVDALIKAGLTEDAVNNIKQHQPTKLDADAEPAKRKKKEAQDDIDSLRGKNVDLETNPEPAKRGKRDAQADVDSFKGKRVDLETDPEPAKRGKNEAQGAVNSFEGKGVSLSARDETGPGVGSAKTNIDSVQGKEVNIVANFISRTFNEAEGGVWAPGTQGTMHAASGLIRRPQIRKGRWPGITWAEPETGGESYIPWAISKRYNAMKVLRTTAGAFGYDLIEREMNKVKGHMSAGVFAIGNASRIVNVNTSLNIPGTFFGDDFLMKAIRQALSEHDRKLETDLTRARSAF